MWINLSIIEVISLAFATIVFLMVISLGSNSKRFKLATQYANYGFKVAFKTLNKKVKKALYPTNDKCFAINYY
jgi:hypothetical protein